MILIVGSGGNGQTKFMEKIKKYFHINNINDRDRIKHIPSPNVQKIRQLSRLNKISKCIFLYNDPFNSVCSHFRRRWQKIQINKLGNYYKLNNYNLSSIDKYFSLVNIRKKDLYSIEYQFNHWYNASQNPKKYGINFPILFVNFSNINKKQLSIFLNRKEELFNISINKNRKNKYNHIISRWPKVKKIYDDLYDKMKKITDSHNKKLIESIIKFKDNTSKNNTLIKKTEIKKTLDSNNSSSNIII